jgi:cysteine-rich repeat protein
MKAKKLLISVVIIAVLIVAGLYAYVNYVAEPMALPSPNGEEVFIVPTISPDGELQASVANQEQSKGSALLGSILRSTNITGVTLKEFEVGEVITMENTHPGDFIAFRCPAGTNVPMRGLIPPVNYDSAERYWYWGPYYETPEMTVSERYSAGQTPNQIFETARFGGNPSADAEVAFLNDNRPITQEGLYVMAGEPALPITIRCTRTCGDGILDDDLGETCDDGGTVDGDGCSATCQEEVSGPSCGDGTCDSDEDCSTCEQDCGICVPFCGDGTCDVNESCSTCESDCGGPCASVCGNGVVESGEACDDGMTCEDGVWCSSSADCSSGTCEIRGNDGCNLSCGIEDNFFCDGTGPGDRTSCSFGVPSTGGGGGSCPDASCDEFEECYDDCSYEEYCEDGADNDEDGFWDCNDPDCDTDPMCQISVGCDPSLEICPSEPMQFTYAGELPWSGDFAQVGSLFVDSSSDCASCDQVNCLAVGCMHCECGQCVDKCIGSNIDQNHLTVPDLPDDIFSGSPAEYVKYAEIGGSLYASGFYGSLSTPAFRLVGGMWLQDSGSVASHIYSRGPHQAWFSYPSGEVANLRISDGSMQMYHEGDNYWTLLSSGIGGDTASYLDGSYFSIDRNIRTIRVSSGNGYNWETKSVTGLSGEVIAIVPQGTQLVAITRDGFTYHKYAWGA